MTGNSTVLYLKQKAASKLIAVGIEDTFTLKIKNPKNSNWVAMYRGCSQFKNNGRGPIFWLSENIISDEDQSIISILHEYGHVIAEWAYIRDEKLFQIIKDNWSGNYFNRPWDEEEFAEDFANFCFGNFSYNSSVIKDIISHYISGIN